MNRIFQILFFLLTLVTSLFAQYNGKDLSFTLGYNYTTSSKIFLNPNAPDIFDQNQFIEIGDFQNFSAELRYRLNESVIFGLSAEYLKNTKKGRHLSSPIFIVEDGLEVYPVELSIYYFLPFSTENFKFFMGGGFGLYLGKRIRSFGDNYFVNVDNEVGYGIQVSTGMDYIVLDNISIKGEIRFRDPDFKTTNRYNNKTVTYEGRSYTVNTNETTSRINIDGITFRIGASFQFSIF